LRLLVTVRRLLPIEALTPVQARERNQGLASSIPARTISRRSRELLRCAVFYYRVGETEYGSGGLLALLSVALWAIGIFALRFGCLGTLLVQVGLFFALTVWNIMRRGRKRM